MPLRFTLLATNHLLQLYTMPTVVVSPRLGEPLSSPVPIVIYRCVEVLVRRLGQDLPD